MVIKKSILSLTRGSTVGIGVSWLLCGSDANVQVGQPSFQQALKKLHMEKQKTTVCHSHTEREIVSSSLDTRMLKAGPEQNGP